VRREEADDRHGDAVAGEVVGVTYSSGSPISRAASRGDSRRERTLPPLTTMMNWRLEPPDGVRRHPATSSNRISARCTLLPAASTRVRL